MPYIPQARRDAAESELAALERRVADEDEGFLVYTLYRLCLAFLDSKGRRFATFNTVLGALSATRLEFYRRQVAPYEDAKIAENGDVG